MAGRAIRGGWLIRETFCYRVQSTVLTVSCIATWEIESNLVEGRSHLALPRHSASSGTLARAGLENRHKQGRE